MNVKPMRDLVLVKTRPDLTHHHTHGPTLLNLPKGRRAGTFFCAEVLARGPLAPLELKKGSKVIVELMSGPDGGSDLDPLDFGCQAGERVAFVHCRLLKAGGEIDQRARTATIELEALEKELRERRSAKPLGARGVDDREAYLEGRIDKLREDMGQMRLDRKFRSRSRAFKPVKDPGLASGILAILE